MERVAPHIGIEPGSGLVGRFGDTVILIPHGATGDGRAEAVGELLELAAAVAADQQLPARTIAARLASYVIGRMSDDVTPFGIVVPVQDGAVMFLRGAVWGTITEGGLTHQLFGEQALTWVDQLIPATFDRLAIGVEPDRPVQADPLSDLQAGVVPGQGFVLTRVAGAAGQAPEGLAEEGAASPEPPIASTPPEPPIASTPPEPPLASTPPEPPLAPAAPEPSIASTPPEPPLAPAAPEPSLAPAPPEPPLAPASVASAPPAQEPAPVPEPAPFPEPGAFGQPAPFGQPTPFGEPAPFGQPAPFGEQAPYPGAVPLEEPDPAEEPDPLVEAAPPAGVGPAEDARPPQDPGTMIDGMQPIRPSDGWGGNAADRHPVGVLTSNNGPAIVLDGAYVFGRDPQRDPAVESGAAAPILMQDPDNVISRVHAYVYAENGVVVVRDASSLDGTYISPPGADEWTRVTAEPSPLPPGWNLRIGGQVFTYNLPGSTDQG